MDLPSINGNFTMDMKWMPLTYWAQIVSTWHVSNPYITAKESWVWGFFFTGFGAS